MLYLDAHVPDALILPEKVDDLHAHLTEIRAHWFRMVPDYLDTGDVSDASVDAVRSCTTEALALPSEPHKMARFDNYDPDALGLQFNEDQHCGYVVHDVETCGQSWSCAVRFHGSRDTARTLFTLNPDGAENYVFLQQKMNQTTLKDQHTTLELTLNTAAGDQGSHLIVAGMSEDRLWMRVHEHSVEVTPAKAKIDLAAPYNLFFGCRSNKRGLQKTLGTFVLRDVIFWPDFNVLDGNHTSTLDALDLLEI